MSGTFQHYSNEYKQLTGRNWYNNQPDFHKFHVERLEADLLDAEEGLRTALSEFDRLRQKLLYVLGRLKQVREDS